jgi:hypothetical protein
MIWAVVISVIAILAGVLMVNRAVTPDGSNFGFTVIGLGVVMLVLSLAVVAIGRAHARDLDGRYANSPLKPWFDHLASGKGLCCSMM